MPGIELTSESRSKLIRNLTFAGWLLLGGPFAFVVFQLDRVRGIGEQPFASVLDQRIEVLSFLMLPPNLTVLAPSVFVAGLATWLAGAERDPWLTMLTRLGIGVAISFGLIGVASIVSIALRDEAGSVDFQSVFLRVGGIAMAAGLATIGITAERLTR